MNQAFLYFFSIHIFCRLSGNNNIIVFMLNFILQFLKGCTEIALYSISRYCISYFFADRQPNPEVMLPGFFYVIDDKLPIRKRFPMLKNLLKFFVFFNPVFLFHSLSPYVDPASSLSNSSCVHNLFIKFELSRKKGFICLDGSRSFLS